MPINNHAAGNEHLPICARWIANNGERYDPSRECTCENRLAEVLQGIEDSEDDDTVASENPPKPFEA